MPGNIGWQGLVVILIVLLLVFGPKRLPEMGRSIGRGMREFKDSLTSRGEDEDEDDHRERRLVAPEDEASVAATARDHEAAR